MHIGTTCVDERDNPPSSLTIPSPVRGVAHLTARTATRLANRSSDQPPRGLKRWSSGTGVPRLHLAAHEIGDVASSRTPGRW